MTAAMAVLRQDAAVTAIRRRQPRRPPAAAAPADRKYLLERVDDAAVVQLYADGFASLPLEREDADLAPLPGGARRARHLLRPAATRTTSRCATCSKQIVTHPQGVDAGDARRDPALHQAVLDQHRPLQQPHRAQVRAEVHAARRSPPRRRRRRRAGATFPTRERRIARRAARAAAADVLRSRTSIRSSPTRRPAPGKDILQASANNLYAGVTMADLEGLRRAVPAQLAAGEDGTASWSKRSTASTAATTRRSARSSGTSKPRFRSRPSRWPRRCAR